MGELLLGAHVSTAGGLAKAPARAHDITANCLQVFGGSPRTWQMKQVAPADVTNFSEAMEKSGVRFACFHASYLINLADDGETGNKSVDLLINELTLADQLGVAGSVVHTGSYKKAGYTPVAFKTLLSNIKKVLAATPKTTALYLENAGNRKIGEKLEELAEIIKAINNERLQICLDTCHLHAAGYNLSSPKLFKEFITTYKEVVKSGTLGVLHLNDSKDPLGSLRDRHENIGQGQVGTAVFKEWLTYAKKHDIPCIIETPGFDQQGPDQKNLEILHSLL